MDLSIWLVGSCSVGELLDYSQSEFVSQFASLSASWLVGWCVTLVPAPCLEVVEVSINDVAKRLNKNLRN